MEDRRLRCSARLISSIRPRIQIGQTRGGVLLLVVFGLNPVNQSCLDHVVVSHLLDFGERFFEGRDHHGLFELLTIGTLLVLPGFAHVFDAHDFGENLAKAIANRLFLTFDVARIAVDFLVWVLAGNVLFERAVRLSVCRNQRQARQDTKDGQQMFNSNHDGLLLVFLQLEILTFRL